jgi:hypothetical protein
MFSPRMASHDRNHLCFPTLSHVVDLTDRFVSPTTSFPQTQAQSQVCHPSERGTQLPGAAIARATPAAHELPRMWCGGR